MIPARVLTASLCNRYPRLAEATVMLHGPSADCCTTESLSHRAKRLGAAEKHLQDYILTSSDQDFEMTPEFGSSGVECVKSTPTFVTVHKLQEGGGHNQ